MDKELEKIFSKQPLPWQFSSVRAYNRSADMFDERLRSYAKNHPECKEKINFTSSCVPCKGPENVGVCLKCLFFDEKRNAEEKDLRVIVNVKQEKIRSKMEDLKVFDVTYTKGITKKEELYQTILEKDEKRAEALLKRKMGDDVEIVEIVDLGAPLHNI